jgi:hypothetical protein
MPIPDQMSISRPMLRSALIAVKTTMDQLVLIDPTHATEVENGTVRCAHDLITAYTATNEIRYDMSNNIRDDTSLIKAGTKLDLYVESLHLLNTKLESMAKAAPPGSILASRATRLRGVISHQFDYIEHCLATDWLSRYSAIRHQLTIRRKSWPDPLVAGWRSVDDLWEPLQRLKGLTERKTDCHPVCLLELTSLRAGCGT